MNAFSWVIASITSILLCVPATRSSAQLWTYLGKYDPKAVAAIEKNLDREACSINSGTELFAGEKSNYKVRTFCIQSFDGSRSKIALSEIHRGHALSIGGPDSSIIIDDISSLKKIHFLRPERDCRLAANVRDVLKGRVHQSQNCDLRSLYVLRFDTTRKIFYTRVQHLNDAVRMDSSAVTRPGPITGDYPMIQLGPDENYYFIDDSWYILSRNNSDRKDILSKLH